MRTRRIRRDHRRDQERRKNRSRRSRPQSPDRPATCGLDGAAGGGPGRARGAGRDDPAGRTGSDGMDGNPHASLCHGYYERAGERGRRRDRTARHERVMKMPSLPSLLTKHRLFGYETRDGIRYAAVTVPSLPSPYRHRAAATGAVRAVRGRPTGRPRPPADAAMGIWGRNRYRLGGGHRWCIPSRPRAKMAKGAPNARA